MVGECDTSRGCANDIVDVSVAVWNALTVSKSHLGETKVTWSNA